MRSDDECWPWLGKPNKDRYGTFRNAAGGCDTAHRASFVVHYGPIPRGKHVLHHCDFRLCVNPKHIYAGTPWRNKQDCIERGRLNPCRGTARLNHKLTEAKVRKLRVDYARCENYNVVAKKYGVTRSVVRRIVKRKAWPHVA